jgi:hypothetical protein
MTEFENHPTRLIGFLKELEDFSDEQLMISTYFKVFGAKRRLKSPFCDELNSIGKKMFKLKTSTPGKWNIGWMMKNLIRGIC